jgi:aminomethyltransferase
VAWSQGEATLSVMTNDKGGIIDDTIITSYTGSHGFVSMVVNGATKDKDLAHLQAKLDEYRAGRPGADVTFELPSRQLVALQGPGAAVALAPLLDAEVDLSQLAFMHGVHHVTVAGIPGCTLTRGGYTGEDGFEISCDTQEVTRLATALLNSSNVRPAGLGARDSLRLEAGLCLYGNDIDETTTPVEAALSWTIGKRRRDPADRRFPGADVIMGQIEGKKWPRRRVGLLLDGAPARSHCAIHDADGASAIGEVTSGTFSPVLKKPISMGYVLSKHSKKGTKVLVEVRPGKKDSATVVDMPFVPSRYFKPT